MHNVWYGYCTMCCMANANAPRVTISIVRKCVGYLVEPSPPTASSKMSGNVPGRLRTASCRQKRLTKVQL